MGAPTSAEPRNPHSCHHHPSSPPTGAYCHLAPQCLLGSSLPSHNRELLSASHSIPGGRDNVLSTGKSSNSSSSSNAATDLTSFVESVLSEVEALVVCGVELDAGAADIVAIYEICEVSIDVFLQRSRCLEESWVMVSGDRIRKCEDGACKKA